MMKDICQNVHSVLFLGCDSFNVLQLQTELPDKKKCMLCVMMSSKIDFDYKQTKPVSI